MMKMRIAAVIAAFSLLGAAHARAAAAPAAEVKAAKGPVQITLRLEKTKVKVKRYLWYKIELKNVGKIKVRIDDKIFKSPYAMHVNSHMGRGIHLEILDSKGRRMPVKFGNYRVRYDWEGPEGQDWLYTENEKKEIRALLDGWKKSGMTEQQQSLAVDAWSHELREKKNIEELTNQANKHWLAPGASTATFAWSERGPGAYEGRAEDDESLRAGYTELFSYRFLEPGKYRIRAVYDLAQPETNEEHIKKYGNELDPWWIKFKTPWIEFEVRR